MGTESVNGIIAKVADGQVTGIDSLEEWNHQTELAKKLRLESEQLRHDQLIRDGETLMSRDASYAVTELIADQLLWEKRDQPLRAALLAAPKNINRQHRTILKSAAVSPAVIAQCETVTTQTISAVLDKLRTKIPKRMNIETVSGSAITPAIEAIFMIEPLFCLSIWRPAACANRKQPVRFTSITFCH